MPPATLLSHSELAAVLGLDSPRYLDVLVDHDDPPLPSEVVDGRRRFRLSAVKRHFHDMGSRPIADADGRVSRAKQRATLRHLSDAGLALLGLPRPSDRSGQ